MSAAQEEIQKPFSAIVPLIADTRYSLELDLLFQIRLDLLKATLISQRLYRSTEKNLVTSLLPMRS